MIRSLERMKEHLCVVMLFVASLLMATPQTDAQGRTLPTVTITPATVSFQAGLYPDYYRNNSVAADMRWVARNDTAIQNFWQLQGDSVLSKLSQLAGIGWVEPSFRVYLLKYYPSGGESDPLIIPLGGELRGMAIKAPPDRNGALFNLIYQLSQRLLSQMQMPESDSLRQIVGHPLLQISQYRRDNMAMLLTLAAVPSFIGADSTLLAYRGPYWTSRSPGRQVFEEQIQKKWILTPQKPLTQWLKLEPFDSPLVDMTRPPQASEDDSDITVAPAAGLTATGTLGFTVKSVSGRFEVDKIDPTRLGYGCGLRPGDAISQVDARRATSVKDLFERLLAGLDKGGSTLTIFRTGKLATVVLRRR